MASFDIRLPYCYKKQRIMNLIRRYIKLFKKSMPVIPPEISDYIVNSYVEMRREAKNNKDSSFTSASKFIGYSPFNDCTYQTSAVKRGCQGGRNGSFAASADVKNFVKTTNSTLRQCST